MLDSIDLRQLALRESEQVEWKENVADIDDVVATLTAFANDLANLGGGYVVCGAAERKDDHGFPTIVRTGLTAERLREVEGRVLTRCRERVSPSITPLVQELDANGPERRVLVFIQPSTTSAHTFRREKEGAKAYVRVGRSTIEARNGVYLDLLVRKGGLEPWDRRPCASATTNDLDLIALRDTLQRMGVFSVERGLDDYLSAEVQIAALVPPLCMKEPLTGILRPRNFAILLFGREVQRFVPGAVSLFSIYPDIDRSHPHARRHEFGGTLIEQARRLDELLDAQSFTTFDKTDPNRPNSVKYPKRALYEAMGNALAHRDYELPDPTRVTAFDDRIEILSPGSLPFGVDPVEFREGRSSPRWRNQSLAWFFAKLQLAQAEGQGIPTILRSMREEGCPPPSLVANEVSVMCTLPARPRVAEFQRTPQREKGGLLQRLQEVQDEIVARLTRDPANVREWEQFATACITASDPHTVALVLRRMGDTVDLLPPEILLLLREALDDGSGRKGQYRKLSMRLLLAAAEAPLRRDELARVGAALIRNDQETRALARLDRYSRDHAEFDDDALLLQLRADAALALAKKRKVGAGRSSLSPASRHRWETQAAGLLDRAEADFRRARIVSGNETLSRFIELKLEEIERLRLPTAETRD